MFRVPVIRVVKCCWAFSFLLWRISTATSVLTGLILTTNLICWNYQAYCYSSCVMNITLVYVMTRLILDLFNKVDRVQLIDLTFTWFSWIQIDRVWKLSNVSSPSIHQFIPLIICCGIFFYGSNLCMCFFLWGKVRGQSVIFALFGYLLLSCNGGPVSVNAAHWLRTGWLFHWQWPSID